MQKNILWVVFATLLLFGMGCITIETTHEQHSDGSAVVTQVMDLSGLMAFATDMGDDMGTTTDGESPEEAFIKICDDASQSVECTADAENWVVTVKKTVSAEDAFYDFETTESGGSKKYTLTIDEMPNFGLSGDEEAGELPSGKLTDPTDAGDVKQLETYGVEWTYTVKMPGKITSAEYGEISEDGKTATFNILEMMSNQKKIVVESEETGIPCLPAFVLLGILGVAATSFLMRE